MCTGNHADPRPPVLMDVREAARYLSVSVDTVRELYRSGELRYLPFGARLYRFDARDLDDFLARIAEGGEGP